MRFNFRLNRTWLAAIFGVFLAVGLGFLLHFSRFGGAFERGSYNLLHVLDGDVRADEAILIYLDEASFRELGQPFNASWDRKLHARLLDRLTAAGARVVVFDIVFTDPNTNSPADDLRFAEAVKKNGRVVLAADNVAEGSFHKEIKPPFDLLLRAADDHIGSAELLPDTDSVVRRHTREDQIPSLSWVAAELCNPKLTQQQGPAALMRWVRYYGQPAWLPATSYYRALDPQRTPDSLFRDKAVFVGGKLLTKQIGERKDEYANPFSYWTTRDLARAGGFFAPGVEVQATMFLNLLRGDWLRRPSPPAERAIMVAVGLLFGLGLVKLRPWVATVVALGGMGVVATGFYLLFTEKLLWFPWLILIAQIALAHAWAVVFNSIQFYVEKRVMEHTLSMYLSPKLVKKFARHPERLRPGAEKQIITIFFTDIADFTSLAEGLDSDELAEFMNRYFEEAVSKCIHKTDGTVVKYIGDAIFSLWNAPEPQSDHALRACEAALLFREMGESRMRGRQVHTRIGIHTGEANVGNFGSLERVDYTALGENVNLASRLEGLNKFVGTETVISRDTRQAIGDQLVTRRLGKFRLKGFDTPVEAFELVGRPELAAATRAWREAFEQAVGNYEGGHLEFARMGFNRTLELKPGDGPSQFYLGRLQEAAELPARDWTGDTQVFEK